MIVKNRPTHDLSTAILAGINAERYLPDPRSISAEENTRLEAGAEARIEAKEALRELVVLAESFGWPEQLAIETREEFVARRTRELDDVAARVERERAKLVAM